MILNNSIPVVMYHHGLRAFRHFFRHVYDVDIDKDKFKIVEEKAKKMRKLYKSDINKFLNFLEKLLK